MLMPKRYNQIQEVQGDMCDKFSRFSYRPPGEFIRNQKRHVGAMALHPFAIKNLFGYKMVYEVIGL